MGKPHNMDRQTVSEVAAMVSDELLSNEALRNIIQLSIYKLAHSLSICNRRSLLPADRPWQMMYQAKAHNIGKVEIIYVLGCIFVLVPLTIQNKFSMSSSKNIKTIFMLCLQEQK